MKERAEKVVNELNVLIDEMRQKNASLILEDVDGFKLKLTSFEKLKIKELSMVVDLMKQDNA